MGTALQAGIPDKNRKIYPDYKTCLGCQRRQTGTSLRVDHLELRRVGPRIRMKQDQKRGRSLKEEINQKEEISQKVKRGQRRKKSLKEEKSQKEERSLKGVKSRKVNKAQAKRKRMEKIREMKA